MRDQGKARRSSNQNEDARAVREGKFTGNEGNSIADTA